MAAHGFHIPTKKPSKRGITDAERVDQLGMMQEAVAELSKKLKRKGLRGKTVTGNLFEAKIYGRFGSSLDRTKLLKLISEDELNSCIKRSKTESLCLRVQRIKAGTD